MFEGSFCLPGGVDKLMNGINEKRAHAQVLEEELARLRFHVQNGKNELNQLKDKLTTSSGELESKCFTSNNVLKRVQETSSDLQYLIEENEMMRNTLRNKENQRNVLLTQFEAETAKRVQRFLMGPVLHEEEHILGEIQAFEENLDHLTREAEFCMAAIHECNKTMAEEAVVALPGSGEPLEEASLDALDKIIEELKYSLDKIHEDISHERCEQEKLDKEIQSLN